MVWFHCNIIYVRTRVFGIIVVFERFGQLFEGVIINNFLLQESYNRWLCFTQYKFYNDSECTASCKCKPSIAVCNKVVQNCPYYTPSRYQSDTPSNENDTCEDTRDKTEDEKREVIYGGLPAFLCPSKGELLIIL